MKISYTFPLTNSKYYAILYYIIFPMFILTFIIDDGNFIKV